MNLRAALSVLVQEALAQCGAEGPALVRPSARPEFGDYQANGVMAAAKALGRKPRELAEEVTAALLTLSSTAPLPLIEQAEVAGPGFINITLHREVLGSTVLQTPLLEHTSAPQTVVVDYSSPNLAKEMHVGHLRSTIIGDALARMLEALGHRVVRQNHVGDWGTQFGMLITELDERSSAGSDAIELHDLEAFYQAAKAHFDADADFAERSRAAVVALQQGDAHTRASWQRFVDLSLRHGQEQYDRLGVSLQRSDVMPESAYNDALAGVIEQLEQKGLLQESDGAMCVFLDEFKNKKGDVLPVIVQKTGGGYLYATTDLAAIAHRSFELKADRALYLVDVRQSLHFKQVFAVARLAGFASEHIQLEHLPFGTMLGKDGKPFKTRAGGVVKLTDLLDEAQSRAAALLSSKAAESDTVLDPEELAHSSAVIGIGAVKYSDLSKNRTSDYVFDWDQMIAFEGDTAPYLQYAYTRVRSVFRKAGIEAAQANGPVTLDEPAERALALVLARFQEVVEQAVQEGYPHYLTGYLNDVATRYSQFYEHCPILQAQAAVRDSRLALCRRTADTLQTGLGLLGIHTVERM
ncbi:MAG: arginine--tRNA ligase [Pseudomonadales bacterium]